MALVEKSVLIERTPAQMFALVDRIEDYPQFLPWIAGTRIRDRRSLAGEAGERMEADMIVSFKVFRESYLSSVELRPPGGHEIPQVLARAAPGGPFERLVMDYRFHETPEGTCDLSFEVDFAFRKGRNGDWKAYDVIIEGISYVTNYRNQVDAEIRKVGIEQLIKNLETQGEKALQKMEQDAPQGGKPAATPST